jgi:hypothetical protein
MTKLKILAEKNKQDLGTLVKFRDIGRVNISVYINLTIKIIVFLEILNLDIVQGPSMS